MLRFDNLCKRYDTHTIFEGLHYEMGAGCVALDDEMGSGKSTLLGILAGTVEADAGEVWLGGHSLRSAPQRAKATLAYMPDDCLEYPQLTGRAFLEQVAADRHTTLDQRTLGLTDRFGLTPHLDKRFEQMSLGTRKKLYLSAAALGSPAVVIADEPTGGLDAAARAVLVDLFKMLGRDRAVFFSCYDTALARACGATLIRFADLRKTT